MSATIVVRDAQEERVYGSDDLPLAVGGSPRFRRTGAEGRMVRTAAVAHQRVDMGDRHCRPVTTGLVISRAPS